VIYLYSSRAVTLMLTLRPLMSRRRSTQIGAAVASYIPKRAKNDICTRTDEKCEDPLIPAVPRNLYWLAGILEAEGSFLSGFPSRPNQPRIQVTGTDQDVIGWIADWLGVKYVALRPRRDGHENRKQAFAASVTAGRAVTIMRELYPLMGKRRREQIDRSIASCDPHRHKRNSAKLTDEQVLDIYRRARSGERQRTIATEYKVDRSTVADIKRGKSWRWLTEGKIS
jgi:hypothetical protein